MHITPDNTGLWGITQTEEAAKKVSELLQEDMEQHHVFFNEDGFHNHIPHHLLALYGTGASPSSLQKGYDENKSYQRPVLPLHPPSSLLISHDQWPESAKPYFGKEEYYPDFLRFFQAEISRLGSYQAVVSQYLFNDTSEEMMVRLFAGFLHPLIQLMYGLEWKQGAIVAEGLAQTAVHPDNLREFLLTTEGKGRSTGKMLDLIEAVKGNEKLAKAARNEDGNKIRDGVFRRAKGEMVELASRVNLQEEVRDQEGLEKRTAEMFDAAVYVAAAAALVMEGQGKVPKFDFFLMHHVNSAPIFVTINKQDWIPLATKVRLLEWKVRMDLLQYAARGAPTLDFDRLSNYYPQKPELGGTLDEIVARVHNLPDDGHAIKLGRAAVICRNICQRYKGDNDAFKIQGDEMWKKIVHLIVDSVEAPGERWVRSAGFEEAWKDVPNKKDIKPDNKSAKSGGALSYET
ncbi:hypothetical protein QBC35DRAFT_517204 [Podospora australis]|uniref:HypA protein n=1 Tax=Podospora australis TaxID=1536484 RepID=A0AAN7ADZ1_9PEZI|nr:hypothetical protein QBC35DRAFT_517204 [Podospora australis]